MRFLVFAAVMFFTLPVLAQPAEEPMGEGVRERFSEEQSQAVALARMPGTVIESSGKWQNGHFYYQFTIQRPAGSVYQVEINADTGEIYQIEAVSLGDLSDLPEGLVDRDLAAKTAASYIESETKGLGTPHVESAATGIYERKIAYTFMIQKSVRRYEVVINAMDGRVMHTREIH